MKRSVLERRKEKREQRMKERVSRKSDDVILRENRGKINDARRSLEKTWKRMEEALSLLSDFHETVPESEHDVLGNVVEGGFRGHPTSWSSRQAEIKHKGYGLVPASEQLVIETMKEFNTDAKGIGVIIPFTKKSPLRHFRDRRGGVSNYVKVDGYSFRISTMDTFRIIHDDDTLVHRKTPDDRCTSRIRIESWDNPYEKFEGQVFYQEREYRVKEYIDYNDICFLPKNVGKKEHMHCNDEKILDEIIKISDKASAVLGHFMKDLKEHLV